MTIDWTKPLEWVTASGSTEDVKSVLGDGGTGRSFGCVVKSGTVWSNADGVLCIEGCGYIRNRAEPAATPTDDETPTMRDQFAMAALTGLMTDASYRYHIDDAAAVAYRAADAMMQARK